MACSSLSALPRACGSGGLVAGLEKLYIVAYNDTSASFAGEIYTVNSGSGFISNIGLDSGSKFVEVGLMKSTAGITEEMTKNQQNGTAYITQTVTIVLSDVTKENKDFIEKVMNQPVVIIVKSRTKKYYAAGLSGDLELSGLTGGLGVAEGDLLGYTLTFTGISSELIRQVDPTLIASIT